MGTEAVSTEVVGGEGADRALILAARAAAEMVWNEDAVAGQMPDPTDARFAAAFVEALNGHLQSAGRMIHRVLEGAARSAEGTNVEPFHGVVEVIQNADDQGAGEVRLLLRDGPRGRQMLLVHDGAPVTFHHVAGMMLPYVTTKEDDADQRGRFGIGLKTLRRISDGVSVHSGPYHFGSGVGVSILNVPAEANIDGFFDADAETMLVLDLVDFEEAAFEAWFADWTDDGLVFLDQVRRFAWWKDGDLLARRTLASEWAASGQTIAGGTLEKRTVMAGTTKWIVHRALVPTPADHARAHKRTGSATPISVAVAGEHQLAGLFVGFRTRVPTSCPFSLDAQFDPSSSREGILDDGWNRWLVDRVGEVIAAAAMAMLRDDPAQAWQLVPLPEDTIGDAGTRWPRERFQDALANARGLFVENALVRTSKGELTLKDFAYEGEELSALLGEAEVLELTGRLGYMDQDLRDDAGRWRRVLDLTQVAARVGVTDLLVALRAGVFARKKPDWWVQLAETLVSFDGGRSELLGIPLWLRADGARVAAQARGSTSRLLVRGSMGDFADRYGLFDRLHPAFTGERAEAALSWLGAHAAYSPVPGNEHILLAFADQHAADRVALDDETLQQVKALLDPITGGRAGQVGARLGAAILLEASDGRRRSKTRLVRPVEAYLPKAIDKDNPNWPNAAAGLDGVLWVSPSYEDRLRTGLGRARKREDGVRPRGARTFLSLLGVGLSPRLVAVDSNRARTRTQRTALAAVDANNVPSDWCSPDLELVLTTITGERGRESVKVRRERAIWLLRCLSREWDQYVGRASVPAEKVARVHTHPKGRIPADWVCRLREAEWVPVGKSGFRRPGEAVLKNASTEAVYSNADFVAGVAAEDVPEGLAEALGLVRRVRASDLLTTLERMRGGAVPFERARVRLAYRQLAALAPRSSWESLGDVAAYELRTRFAARGGLIVVDDEEGRPTWRRPDQVLRGRRVLPTASRYVPDGEAYGRLWRFLNISETQVGDCCSFLKEHAERSATDEQTGVLIEVYRFLDSLLAKEGAAASAVRHLPLVCGGQWRAKRPIYLVEQDDLRLGMARALPDRFFWDPPCRPSTIPHLVNALGLTRLAPQVAADTTQLARERGEDLSHRFHEAVSHLSDQLARTSTDMRGSLTVGWDSLRNAPLRVYEGPVPVTVTDQALPDPVGMTLRVHLSRDPLELHVAEDAIGSRDAGGRAVASLFTDSTKWNFDAEWALAWQEAERRDADDLRFVADEEERRRQLEKEAARIAVATKSKGKVQVSTTNGTSKEPPEPFPPRKLKTGLAGVESVTVVAGQPPKAAGQARKGILREEPEPRPRQSSGQMANTAYSTGELEDLGWAVARHVLDHSDRSPLVDFRNRQRVGADGAIDWCRFVELKACGRTMPGSVQLTLAEFARAAERGKDYLLVVVSGLEDGFETRVKIIFDPIRNATLSRSELIRLTGLAAAPGIELAVGDETWAGPIDAPEEGI